MSTVKSMKLLGNSTCSLAPQPKHLLYKSCVLPITLYSHQLWFYNKVPLLYPIKELNKMQCHAAIWNMILSTFCISPLFNIEAITDFIPVKFHL